jgi:hypothetical protein
MTDAKKPSSSSTSLFAWLGRQVGYVSGAYRKPPKIQPVVAHREASIQEASPPDQPHVTLRRTVIDEVLIDPEKK